MYRCGNIKVAEHKGKISDEIINKEEKLQYKLPKSEIMLKRIRYFTDGLALGSKVFVKDVYKKFGKEHIGKKNQNVYKTGLSSSVLFVRKLVFQWF